MRQQVADGHSLTGPLQAAGVQAGAPGPPRQRFWVVSRVEVEAGWVAHVEQVLALHEDDTAARDQQVRLGLV